MELTKENIDLILANVKASAIKDGIEYNDEDVRKILNEEWKLLCVKKKLVQNEDIDDDLLSITLQLVMNTPNDMDLGKAIRKLYLD